MYPASDFQPRQIVCLEHQGTCLYAEVIQVVVSRQLCWVRPLLLGTITPNLSSDELLPPKDLRNGADLIWPLALFRAALDTEVIPLLAMLPPLPQSERNPVISQQLNQFIYQVWQAYKDAFCSTNQA